MTTIAENETLLALSGHVYSGSGFYMVNFKASVNRVILTILAIL